MKKCFGIIAIMLAVVACYSDIDNQPIHNGIDNGECITITAKLAPLSSPTKAVQDQGNGTIRATWQEGETIAVLYRANGEHNVAVAAITGVDDGGTATISFNVVSGTADDTPCTLVYPYNAARADGTGIKDYNALFSTQDGSLRPDLDVRVGDGTIQVSQPGLVVTTQPAPRYAIFRFTLKNSDSNNYIPAKTLTVRNAANEVITTVSLSTATSSLYVALPAAASGTVYKFSADDDDQSTYWKVQRLTKETQAGYYYTTTLSMTTSLAVDISRYTDNFTVQDGTTLTGELQHNVKISIRSGAAVTLAGVTINGVNSDSENNHYYRWGGITCMGDATLILKDGTTNIVKGFDSAYPGIHVQSTQSTLIIQGEIAGTGKLMASSNGYAAGIGGGYDVSCGNIVIEGGIVEATGGIGSAGIGSGKEHTCGDITISGGIVNATGGDGGAGIGSGSSSYYYGDDNSNCGAISISGGNVTALGGARAAGIGSGFANGGEARCGSITIFGGVVTATGGQYGAGIGTGSYDNTGSSVCGDITIMKSVMRVVATKGSSATNSIGAGLNGTCGTVTIGDNTGPVQTSPFTFLPEIPGTLKGKFSVSGTNKVYFSQGNLQATYDGTAWSWAFAEHQWDFIGGKTERGAGEITGNNLINGNGTVSAPGTIDLFGWVGSSSKVLTGYPARYGISNSMNKFDDVYGNDSRLDHLMSDWGTLAITNGGGVENVGWRTLSAGEWIWMLGPDKSPNPGSNCRTSSTVNGTPNARFTQATINTDAAPVKGLIIFPDDYEGGTPAGVTWDAINTGATQYATACTSAGWLALENAGCVFLPAADDRWGNYVGYLNWGYYWTSTSGGNGFSYVLEFMGKMLEVSPGLSIRHPGYSVRVVRNAN